ncbi:MAG TPA: oligosaccharide flippase family protein [Prolixibacteraceae bacterium]
MKSVRKYITNISAFQFIQLLRFAVLFLVGVVFAHHYSKQEIGQYEVMLFIASAVSFFWLSGILQTFLSLVKDEETSNGDSGKSSHYFNGFVLLVLFSVLAVLFLVVFRQQVQGLLNGANQIPYFNWLLAYLFLSSPSNFIEYIFLGKSKPVHIIEYGLLSYGLQFVFLTVPPLLNLPLEYSIIGLIVINALRFIFLLIILHKYSQFTLNLIFMRKHIKLAYPLIFSSLLSGSGQYIDTAIVTHFFDTGMFAIFRYGAREFPLVIILANSLSLALIPEFSRLSMAECLLKIKSNSLRLMHILFPLTAILILSSNWLFTFFFTANFSLSAKIFNIYLLQIVFRLIFPETILIGKRITKIFLAVSLAEIILNVALSLILVRYIGITGIVFGTILANLFERSVLIVIVKHKLKVKVHEYIPVNWYLAYSAAILSVYYVVDFWLYPLS